MINIHQEISLEVNGEAIRFHEVLRLARWHGQLGFISDAIDAALVRQAAAQRGIKVSVEELQEAADEFRLSRGLVEVKAIRNYLANNHLTLKEWESHLEEEVIAHKLRNALTEDAVEGYFAEHRLLLE